MAWNNPQIPTRSSRNRRNKMNGLLNWAIGIVIVAILFVGGYLLYSVLTPSSQSADGKVTTKTTVEKSTSKKATASTKNKTTSSSTSTDQSTGKDGTTSASSTAKTSSKSTGSTDTTGNTSDAYHFVGGGPNGPWQPIGTVQSGSHTTSYTEGSVDWNEQIKALLYATNINDNDYILWRLQNGGSPDKSEGIISTKEDQNKKYDVMLQWVNGKGWKPLSVK